MLTGGNQRWEQSPEQYGTQPEDRLQLGGRGLTGSRCPKRTSGDKIVTVMTLRPPDWLHGVPNLVSLVKVGKIATA